MRGKGATREEVGQRIGNDLRRLHETRGTCAECLQDITLNDVPKHASLHQVGTAHLFVPKEATK